MDLLSEMIYIGSMISKLKHLIRLVDDKNYKHILMSILHNIQKYVESQDEIYIDVFNQAIDDSSDEINNETLFDFIVDLIRNWLSLYSGEIEEVAITIVSAVETPNKIY